MSLFDLVFILLFLTAVANLIAIVALALRSRLQAARRVFFRLLAGACVYFAIVIVVSAVSPRRILKLNEPLCFDDWCIAVATVTPTPQTGQIDCRVEFVLSSRARRISQRENNLTAYIATSHGQRFNRASGASFNIILNPGQTVTVSQNFVVPANASEPGLVIRHEGGFPIGWFIIGYDAWFQKPPVLPLKW